MKGKHEEHGKMGGLTVTKPKLVRIMGVYRDENGDENLAPLTEADLKNLERKRQMTFAEYQEAAHKTNEYPKKQELLCLVTGLPAEVGEFCGKINKAIRDGWDDLELKRALLKEGGDIQWSLSEILRYFGIRLEQAAEHNIAKLADRRARGVIKGSGDER